MKLIIKCIIIGLGFSLLTSCASIVTGTKQKIAVATTPAKGAQCLLSNKRGTWTVNKTPAFVVVHRDFDELDVTCNKPGYKTGHKQVKSHTKAMAFGNVILGGVVGGGVDIASGAAYDYPERIVIPMRKGKA